MALTDSQNILRLCWLAGFQMVLVIATKARDIDLDTTVCTLLRANEDAETWVYKKISDRE